MNWFKSYWFRGSWFASNWSAGVSAATKLFPFIANVGKMMQR